MIKRDTKKTKIEKKTNFLNPAQRKELKLRLIEKFTKLYGLSNPQRVKEIIENFFNDTQELNSQKLTELEIFVKKDALKYKSLIKKKSEVVAEPQTVGDEYIRVETQQTPTNAQLESENADETEDHWDSVGMYQALLLKQEQDLAKQRKLLQQKAIKAQLDYQIQEKQKKNKRIQFEEESYVSAEQKMQNNFKTRESEEDRIQRMEKQQLKDMQLKSIEERNKQLEEEQKKEKQVEDKIVNCLQEDLARQKQLHILRAEEKKKEMQKLMVENEERKRQHDETEKKSRQEEIELQKMANEVQDELEKRKQEQQKVKHEKIQQLLAVGENVVKNQQNKNKLEEERIQRYLSKKNKEIERNEKRLKELEMVNRDKYKDFLEQQVKEKELKTKAQDNYIREQADIWKRDEQVYSNVHQLNKENIKNSMQQYKEDLERQIREKEEKEKKQKQMNKPNEELMKLNLLTRIQELDIKKRVLADQLNNSNLIM